MTDTNWPEQEITQEALDVLDTISDLLTNSELDLERMLAEIVRTTAERMHLKASAIRLMDETTGSLVIRAVFGLSHQFLSAGPSFDDRSRYARLVANDGVLNIEDVLTEPDLNFTEAASDEGIRSLLAVGLYADKKLIGALSVYRSRPERFTDSEVQSLRIIANQVSLALIVARLHEIAAEKDRLERDLALASEIQTRVLPLEPPKVPGFQIATRHMSWDWVGGDFFDIIEFPLGNLGIALGDVSGKGVWASLLMFVVRTALRAHAGYQYSVQEIIVRVNQTLHRDTEDEQFATLVYGVLNVPGRFFTYVNASNPPPLLIRKDKMWMLDKGGLPVGILEDATYEQEMVQLEPGDLLVLYSDGYFEVFDTDGEMFGAERFRDRALANRSLDPDAFIAAMEREITDFLGTSPDGDDRTIVVVKVEEA